MVPIPLLVVLAACTNGGTDTEETGDSADGSDTSESPPELVLWTQDVDGGDSLGAPNADYADQGRELVDDPERGLRYGIGWGVIEGANDPANALVGYVRAYDASTGVVVGQLRVGSTSPGKQTRVFNGVIGEEAGVDYLYATGKTTTDIGVICAGGTGFPASGADTSTDGLILQIALDTFTIHDCLAIRTAGDRFDEIASLEWDSTGRVLWVAGSTKGNVVAGSRIPGNEPGNTEAASDVYAARLSPGLDDAPLFVQFGSVAFDETLGTDFDPATQRLYVGGSTRGDLCDTYPNRSTSLGYACHDGQGGFTERNFDTYLAMIEFQAPSTLGLRWVYQNGVGTGQGAVENDVAHDVEWYSDGTDTLLYETGYHPVGGTADIRVSRIRLDATGNPGVVAGEVDRAVTFVGHASGNGDNGSTLYVGDDALWVTGTMNGARDHAGTCGFGEASANEGHLLGFAHAAFADDATPDTDLAWIVTTGPTNQRSGGFEGLTWSAGSFWIAGNTTAEPGTGQCGTETGDDWDDETDAAYYVVDVAAP